MEKIYDCIVIGGGPAGLSAAIYLARFQRSVLVLDKEDGRSSYSQVNENYLGFPQGIPSKVLKSLGREQAQRYGAEYLDEDVEEIQKKEIFIVKGNNKEYLAKTLILAMGVTDKFPAIKGIHEYIGRSVFWCITCDGHKTVNKKVVVIGRDNEAASTCLQFLNYTKDLQFVTNCYQDQIEIDDKYLKRLEKHNIPLVDKISSATMIGCVPSTYAYRYKAEGREICADEGCQVFSASKADNPPDRWKQAVQETKGMVLEDVVTYFSSTAGGWSSTSGWDTTDHSGGGNFIDKSYEKLGGSPWLYKAWYRKGYTSSGDACGRSNPWLSPEEMADIVNAHLVLTKSTDQGERDRVTPVTTSCWGGTPYSMEELRNVASKYGGISSATSVSVGQGDGNTNNVTINGISISGSDFKQAFTIRAPGYLRIPQSGFSFFNIEKK